MQPLKLLAIVIGALPLAAFLATLYFTDGAPLQPLTPGQESEPAAATPLLPQAELVRPGTERHDQVAAAGHLAAVSGSATEGGIDAETIEGAFASKQLPAPLPLINHEREAQVLLMLFGVSDPYYPPAP